MPATRVSFIIPSNVPSPLHQKKKKIGFCVYFLFNGPRD